VFIPPDPRLLVDHLLSPASSEEGDVLRAIRSETPSEPSRMAGAVAHEVAFSHRTCPLVMLRLLLLAGLVVAVPASAQTLLIEDVPTYSAGMGRADGPFTLVSLRDGAVVVAGDATARADSASAAWDLGLRGTEVVLNGGASGPGGVRGALVAAPFDAVSAVPDSLASDGEGACSRGEARVVCGGSGNGWYLYEGNGVEPLADRTLVVARPDGSAVKVLFVRYVLGETDATGERPRFVTLEVAPL